MPSETTRTESENLLPSAGSAEITPALTGLLWLAATALAAALMSLVLSSCSDEREPSLPEIEVASRSSEPLAREEDSSATSPSSTRSPRAEAEVRPSDGMLEEVEEVDDIVDVEDEEVCEPLAEGRVRVLARGSWGPLPGEGDLVLDGDPLATAALGQLLEGPLGCELVARATVDTLDHRTVLSPPFVLLSEETEVVISVPTGLLRPLITRAGRATSGIISLFRIPDGSSVAEEEPCATMSFTRVDRELTSGWYLAVIRSHGLEVSREVEVVAGEVRALRVDL